MSLWLNRHNFLFQVNRWLPFQWYNFNFFFLIPRQQQLATLKLAVRFFFFLSLETWAFKTGIFVIKWTRLFVPRKSMTSFPMVLFLLFYESVNSFERSVMDGHTHTHMDEQMYAYSPFRDRCRGWSLHLSLMLTWQVTRILRVWPVFFLWTRRPVLISLKPVLDGKYEQFQKRNV